MDSHFILLILSFFFVATVYAAVGFGGGSSYLAILAQPMFLLTPALIRPTALLCNIIVVTGSVLIFYREGKIDWKKSWPFLITSVPMAYFGGRFRLEDEVFFIVLGIVLLIAAVCLWIQPQKNSPDHHRFNTTGFSATTGGGIGFLSGLVSIGGGIFLSPVLHFMHWAEARKISALASLFILVNSVSGLAGQLQTGVPHFRWSFLLPLLGAVLAGGQLGAHMGARKFNPVYIKRITAVLMALAALNILRKYT